MVAAALLQGFLVDVSPPTIEKVFAMLFRAGGALDAPALIGLALRLGVGAAAAVDRLEFDRGGGDDGTKPRTERGFSREVLRLPPAAALGPGGSLDEFWTRAAQHCGVAEVEIDGKLVYPF